MKRKPDRYFIDNPPPVEQTAVIRWQSWPDTKPRKEGRYLVTDGTTAGFAFYDPFYRRWSAPGRERLCPSAWAECFDVCDLYTAWTAEYPPEAQEKIDAFYERLRELQAAGTSRDDPELRRLADAMAAIDDHMMGVMGRELAQLARICELKEEEGRQP